MKNLETFITERLSNGTFSTEDFLELCAQPKLKKQCFNMLLDANVNISGVDRQGQNALFKAAESGNLVLLRSLLECGLDPMQRDHAGEIPLAAAVRCGNLSVAGCLLNITENPGSVADNDGASLLHKAAWGDMPQVAAALIDRYGADVECRDNSGRTALHIAAYQGSCKMLKYLLTEKAADVNAVDLEGRTPLFSAAYDGNHRALKLLCEHGADLTVKDNSGLTALDFAVSKKELETVKFLKRQNLPK